MSEFGQLYAIAQISVAIIGFSSMVVVLKERKDKQWDPGHVDRFHGMLLHELMALLFCVLPSMIAAFASSLEVVWWVGSLLLGLQLIAHGVLIAKLPSSNRYTRFGIIPAVVAIGLLAMNVLRIGGGATFGPYLVGVLWHMLQGAALFMLLVWIVRDRAVVASEGHPGAGSPEPRG